jgi:deoxyribonuclease-4
MTARIGAHLNGGVKGALDHARRIGLGRDQWPLDSGRAEPPHRNGSAPAAGATGGGDAAWGEGAPGAASQDGFGVGGPIQLWSRNPSAWRTVTHDPADVDRFRAGCAELDLGPVFVHGIYLMNFASPEDALWERSIDALIDQLRAGAALGAQAVIVHPGSGGTLEVEAALDRCARAVRVALHETDDVEGRPLVALETCAGGGRTIGRTYAELAGIVERLDRDAGVAIALDTAHLWGSGVDLASEEGLSSTLDELVTTCLAERVVAIHANDSKVPLGSRKDRHENIGRGMIGEAAFRRMLAHPLLRSRPWVLEVPGYDGQGPDALNLAALRWLAREEITAAP